MRKFTYGFVMTLLFIAVSGFGFNSKPLLVEYHLKCCKIRKKGKACGDTCISRDYECHKPPGCACDG